MIPPSLTVRESGIPTKYALLEMARKVSVNDDVLRTMMLRLEEIPFDSDRKLMSTKYELHGVPYYFDEGRCRCPVRPDNPYPHRRRNPGTLRGGRPGGRSTARIWNSPRMVCVCLHLPIKRWKTTTFSHLKNGERLYIPRTGSHGGPAEEESQRGRVRRQTGRNSPGYDHW